MTLINILLRVFQWTRRSVQQRTCYRVCKITLIDHSLISQINFNLVDYPNVSEYRSMYDELINKCVNVDIKDNFNLSAFSSIEYCITAEAHRPLGENLKSNVPIISTNFFFSRFPRNFHQRNSRFHFDFRDSFKFLRSSFAQLEH